MRATLEHDNILNIVQFNAGGINLIYAVPSRLETIEAITDYDDGFITMQTNYGEEYTDLIELLDNSNFSEGFKNKAKNVFHNITLDDIILKRG